MNSKKRLVGVINPMNDMPCFAIPIFTENARFYVQKINNKDIIQDFYEVRVNENIIIKTEKSIERNIEDRGIYAFYYNDMDILIGHREPISDVLEKQISEFTNRPFLSLELASFIGNDNLKKKAMLQATALMTVMKKIKVLIVDSQPLIREGVRKMLILDPDLMVIGEASSGEEAIEKINEMDPDIVLMEIRLPDINGLEVTNRIKEKNTKVNIIFLTAHYKKEYLAQAAEAGVKGYLLKDTSTDELIRAIKMAYIGQSPLSPIAEKALLNQFIGLGEVNRKNILSHRQLEILRMVASGVTNKAIARRLYLSEATIKDEINTILSKPEITNNMQAVSEAYSKKSP